MLKICRNCTNKFMRAWDNYFNVTEGVEAEWKKSVRPCTQLKKRGGECYADMIWYLEGFIVDPTPSAVKCDHSDCLCWRKSSEKQFEQPFRIVMANNE